MGSLEAVEAAAAVERTPLLRRDVVGFWLVVGAVGVATLGAVLASENPLVAAVPVLLVAIVAGAVRLPLRWSVAVLLIAVLAIDGPGDGAEIWRSPLEIVGEFLRGNVDRWIPGVRISGVEVVSLFLLAVAAYRRVIHAKIDEPGRVPIPRIVGDFLIVYLLGFGFAWVNGLATGGAAAPWKVRNILQVPFLFLVFQLAFRGPVDHGLIGRVVIAAALVKAAMAAWVQYVVASDTGGHLEYATTHADSVLFVVAAFIPIVRYAESPSGRRLKQVLLLVPPMLVGIVANGRRLAWVMGGMCLAALYLLSPWNRWKRGVTHAVLILVPLLAIYAAVGWNSSFGLFAPLRLLQSLTDGAVDLSKLWRDIEDWNIAMSIREAPVLGIGLGREYTIFMPSADLTALFPEYRAWPHNSVLGMILLCGYVGFTAMWLLYALAVFLAARAYRAASGPDDRAAALTCIATIICCMVLAYGDLGANFVQHRVAWALALAVAARLPHAMANLSRARPVGVLR